MLSDEQKQAGGVLQVVPPVHLGGACIVHLRLFCSSCFLLHHCIFWFIICLLFILFYVRALHVFVISVFLHLSMFMS